ITGMSAPARTCSLSGRGTSCAPVATGGRIQPRAKRESRILKPESQCWTRRGVTLRVERFHHRGPGDRTMLDTPSLSIVVIGRNEGPRLVRCLESVAAMHRLGREPELIYVDSASSDGSVDRA